MALPYKRDSLEGLPEPLVKEYREVVEGDTKHYVLDLEGAFISEEPIDALKRAKDHEKNGRHSAEKKAKELQLALETKETELEEIRKGNIPKADMEALEKSWKDKFDRQSTDYTTQLTARDRTIQTHLVDSIANKIANDVSLAPDLILPHVKSRLTAELIDGQFQTRVLDKEGKPSAMSIEELQKDIFSDKRFSAIIKGGKGSGGGASGSGTKPAGSGAPPVVDLSKQFDWNKATPSQIAAYQRAKKAAEAERNGTGG